MRAPLLAAFAALAGIGGAALAQDWQPVSRRAPQLSGEIDAAVRDGRVTEADGQRLRRDLRAIVDLEARYRASRPGLTGDERAELDRRVAAMNRILLVDLGEREHKPREQLRTR